MLTLETLDISYVITEQEPACDYVRASIAAAKDKPAQANWDDYWSKHSAAQSPTYLMRYKLFRYQGRFIAAPVDTELRFHTALKDGLFRRYFAGVDSVMEFGCGSGNNLKQAKEIFPDIKLYGYDWAPAAVKLVSGFAAAGVFDMRRPQPLLPPLRPTGQNFGVLTCGAMEQLGDDFMPFYDFLRGLQAAVYVHIEPLLELYDGGDFDALAVAYHRRRGYLGEFLTALRGAPDVRIIDCQRTGFGNVWNEGYSFVAWAPQRAALQQET